MATDMEAGWRSEATCQKYVDQNPVFAAAWLEDPRGRLIAQTARLICREQCPVREQCLRDALTDPEAEGIRGGYYFHSGVTNRGDQRGIFNYIGEHSKTSQREHRRDEE